MTEQRKTPQEIFGLSKEAVDLLRKKWKLEGSSDAIIANKLAEVVLADAAQSLGDAAKTYNAAGVLMMDAFNDIRKASLQCKDTANAAIKDVRDYRMAITAEATEMVKVLKALRDAANQETKAALVTIEQVVAVMEKVGQLPQHTVAVVAEALNRIAHNA